MWPHDSDEYQFGSEFGERALRDEMIRIYERWNIEGLGLDAVRKWLKENGKAI
jgi:hypothetical protein